MTIQFTIYGNQENDIGNPIPYFRQTQGSKFSAGAKRYHQWQEYVRDAIMVSGNYPIKRFQGAPVADMRIKIYWANEAHADADNIWKGIADSLFENDKHVRGQFEYQHAADKKGRVNVIIEFLP